MRPFALVLLLVSFVLPSFGAANFFDSDPSPGRARPYISNPENKWDIYLSLVPIVDIKGLSPVGVEDPEIAAAGFPNNLRFQHLTFRDVDRGVDCEVSLAYSAGVWQGQPIDYSRFLLKARALYDDSQSLLYGQIQELGALTYMSPGYLRMQQAHRFSCYWDSSKRGRITPLELARVLSPAFRVSSSSFWTDLLQDFKKDLKTIIRR